MTTNLTLYRAKSYDDLQQQLGMMKLIVHEFIYPYGVDPELLDQQGDYYTIVIQVFHFWDGTRYRVLEGEHYLRSKMAQHPELFSSFEAHDCADMLNHLLTTGQWYFEDVVTVDELKQLYQRFLKEITKEKK